MKMRSRKLKWENEEQMITTSNLSQELIAKSQTKQLLYDGILYLNEYKITMRNIYKYFKDYYILLHEYINIKKKEEI